MPLCQLAIDPTGVGSAPFLAAGIRQETADGIHCARSGHVGTLEDDIKQRLIVRAPILRLVNRLKRQTWVNVIARPWRKSEVNFCNNLATLQELVRLAAKTTLRTEDRATVIVRHASITLETLKRYRITVFRFERNTGMAKTKKLTDKQLDKAIGTLWAEHGNGVAVDIMNIGRIFKDAKAAYAANPTSEALAASIKESVVKYRTN